jgi:hypothetical protein
MTINRLSVGSNLYLFQSQEATSDKCVIIAHSGRTEADRGSVHMPAGTTMHFYTRDGATFEGNTKVAVAVGRSGLRTAEDVGPGQEAWDYRVQKFRDTGWRDTTYRNIKKEMEQNSGDWQPHVVTIRDRQLGERRTMHLSDVIAEVQREHPHIKEFHLVGCRQTRDGVEEAPPGVQARRDAAKAGLSDQGSSSAGERDG